MLEVSQESICHYESGEDNPSVDTLIKLAQIFGVTTDYLLGITDQEKPSSAFGELFDEQEQVLINHFRGLCPSAKQRAIGYIQGAKENQGR